MLAVVIPTFGRPVHLNQVLPSYLGDSLVSEVVIVDDGSSEPLVDHLDARWSADPRVRVIRHVRTMGLPAARNTGVMHVRAEFTLFGEDDVVLEPGYVSALLEFRRAHGPCVVVGPLVQQLGDESFADARARVDRAGGQLFDAKIVDIHTCYAAEVTEIPFGHAIMLAETSLFADLKFSTVLGGPTFMGEDREFQLAARRHRGVPTYVVPGPIALHLDKSKTSTGGTRSGNDALARIASGMVCRWIERSTYRDEIAAFFPGAEPAALATRAVVALGVLEAKRQVQAHSRAARLLTRAWYDWRAK